MRRNKCHIFYIILTTFYISCNNSGLQPKIENTGNHEEIILVLDDADWNSSTGIILKEIFEKEIEGIPQPENMFNLIQINKSEFNRIFKTHKNIIFVSKEVKDSYTKNKWANDQIVIYLNQSLEKEFKENCLKARNFIDRKELESINLGYKNGHNKKASKFIKDEFGLDIYLPTEYSTPIKEKGVFIADFHSFNEKQDLLKYIILFEIDQNQNNIQKEILDKTDSVLQLYVSGAVENSYVQIDRRISVRESKGVYRGLWTLKNGFMAGPFIMKVYYQENRVIISLGLVFYPNENKRKFVRIFEAIL